MAITIYHNPNCGTSRKVLAMLRDSGEELVVVEYLNNPPSRQRLVDLLHRMALTPRDLLRRKGTPYDELGLDDPNLTDDELIDRMLEHPILIERPIVATLDAAGLCRPAERVFDLVPNARPQSAV